MAQEDVAAAANGATAVEKSVTFTAYKPQLIVEAQKVGEAVAFYKAVFDATETGGHSLYPKRKADQELPHVVSAELKLAGTTVVVSDVSVHSGSNAKTGTVSALLETDDVEAAVAKAVAAGAVKVEEVSEGEADGGVKGKVTDPFGFTWIFVSPAEKKSDEEENKEV
ncbi:Uncharacterized protein Rs2_14758 [Raphanus sativus]|uniref:Uncharacterized protein At5g48480 n=1 Tax=Raphanus sativus TaxID=3726 RepID=A0A6J0N190_RAPSA|nr:uncharacterized protein At5g48480 [Raphanus sativus]KAJ4900807.1 Uncharacterized protein Rs2_14758 [Raphanus sativus]